MSRLLPILAGVAIVAIGALSLSTAGASSPDTLEGPRAIATAQALSFATHDAQLAHERAVTQSAALSWLWFGFQVLVIGAGAVLLLLAMWNLETHLARRMRLNEQRLALLASLAETRSGTVSMRGDLRAVSPQIVDLSEPSDARQVAEPVADTFRLNSGPLSVMVDKHPQERPADVKAALRLLRLSMQRNGATANRIATWRELSMSADVWQRSLEAIRPHIVAKAGRGGGTFVKVGTLHGLYARLSAGRPGA